MRYSKLLLVAILILSTLPCFAVGWKKVSDDNREIFIDVDSINYHNNSIYYNVKYHDKKAEQEVIATIQSNGNKAGVVATYKSSEYFTNDVYGLPRIENKDITKALTPKIATTMKELTSNSLLYGANNYARMVYNRNKLSNTKPKEESTKVQEVDWTPYMELLGMRFKNNWKRPKGSKGKKATVLLKINKTGELMSCDICESSGDEDFDNSVLKAVFDTGHLIQLPYNYKKDSVNLKFIFN